ncbi:MAG: hypothetical protein RL213_1147 [Bacteroidota bacterium]
MKKLLLNVLAVVSLVLIAQSGSAQGTYTICSVPGNATTDSTGTLYDTGGPNGQYQNNENCTLLVQPSCAVSITLTFQQFATEANFDFFRVYDGTTVAAPQLLNANGQTLPGPVTCVSGSMLIVWRSDVSIVYDGFQCSWTSVIASAVAPTAACAVNDNTPPLNTNVQFSDSSVGSPTGWLWDFGDGDTSRRQNPLHAYSAPGTYNVMFVAFSCTESDTAYLTVNVQAAPQISVDPDSIVANAYCGDTATYQLDVTNVAGGELFWTSDVDVSTGLPVRVLAMKYGTDQFSEYPNTINSISPGFTNYVLTQTSTSNPSVLSSLLFGTNVLLIPEQEFGNSAIWTTLAPVIQNYVNNGGSVIFCGAFSSQVSCINSVGIFSGTYNSDAVQNNLTVVDNTHPLANLVPGTFTAPSATYTMDITNPNKNQVVADQGADVVTWLNYGSGKAIFLAFDYFDPSTESSRILANAIEWGGINGLPSWISLSQTFDTLNAGDTSHVTVTFQTTGLPAGTYISAIPVANNDLTNPVVLVPCTLTITGDPIVALSDTCVDFGSVMQYRPETRSFDVINNGCDTLFVTSIVSNNTQFTVNAPFTYLVPGAHGVVNVTFVSNATGTFTGTITVYNSDVDTSVCLSANVYPAPDVNANPASISATAPACSNTATQTLTVENLGGSDLTYSVTGLPGWLSYTTTGDTVTPGSSQTVTLTFNSGTLTGGTYTANVTLISNDPRTPNVQVAVTFVVGTNPCMNFTSQSNTCTGQTDFTSTAINTPSSYSWDFGDGSALGTTANPTHYYSQNGTYTVTLIACNGAGCDTVIQSLQAIITGPQPTTCYPLTSQYCCGIGLTNVTLANINNASNDAIDGYQNYTCSDTTTLERGQTYNFTAETGFTYPENVIAWIDWNADTQLDPATEQVFSDVGQQVLTFHSGTISVPGNAVVGQPLRFRIASDYSANPVPAPCLNLQYGQVEDYSILVSLPVGVEEAALNIPFSVFPNPFAASTRIEYRLSGTSTVSLEVYNAMGEKVQSLVVAEKQNGGVHTYSFEGTAAGIYTVRLSVDGRLSVQKIVKF